MNQWNLEEFIRKNSWILEVSTTSKLTPLGFPNWLVTAWLGILLASLNSSLLGSHWVALQVHWYPLFMRFNIPPRDDLRRLFLKAWLSETRARIREKFVWDPILRHERSVKEVNFFPKCSILLIIDVLRFTLITRNLETCILSIPMTLELCAWILFFHARAYTLVGKAFKDHYWPYVNPCKDLLAWWKN